MHEAAEDAGHRQHDSPILGIITIFFIIIAAIVSIMIFFLEDREKKKEMITGCLSYIFINPITWIFIVILICAKCCS